MNFTVAITRGITNVISVRSPYCPQFPPHAKKLGGRWTGEVWTFDGRSEQAVRALLDALYGTDGSDNDQPPVTVRVPVEAAMSRKDDQTFYAAGCCLVNRPGRDTDVRLGDGVAIVSGGFPQWGAGSMRYPELAPEDGTVLEVRDVAPGMAAKMVDEVPGAFIVTDALRQREDLLAERERLVARLAEIDAALGAELAAMDDLFDEAATASSGQVPHIVTVVPTTGGPLGPGIETATWSCSCGAVATYQYLAPPTAERVAADHLAGRDVDANGVKVAQA